MYALSFDIDKKASNVAWHTRLTRLGISGKLGSKLHYHIKSLLSFSSKSLLNWFNLKTVSKEIDDITLTMQKVYSEIKDLDRNTLEIFSRRTKTAIKIFDSIEKYISNPRTHDEKEFLVKYREMLNHLYTNKIKVRIFLN